ncbi:MAG: 23S rRNA (uracil(1939)-C(5))-methyltransferase RlmD [Deltaproteobacteria bacterium]
MKNRPDPAPITTEVLSLSHDGRGVARVDGKAVFLDGGLTGEKVRFMRLRKRSRFDEGRVVEVIEPSPDRVPPACPHFGVCGGCSLQHLRPSAQIAFKEGVLIELLERFGGIAPDEILPPLTGPVLGYRRSARLGVRYVQKKGKVLVGFREKRTNLIADIDVCPVLPPEVSSLIPELKALIASLDAFREIPQIEISAGDLQVALVFRTLVELSARDLSALEDLAVRRGLKVFLQPGGPASLRLLAPHGAPELCYSLPEHSVEISFLPLDFIQVNGEINRKMVTRGVELLAPGPNDTVLDLFSGLGNFALPLAKRAGTVIGIEGDLAMTVRAQENARRNRISNARFLAMDLTRGLDPASWGGKGIDLALVDPPRSGAIDIVPGLCGLRPKRIVYVSCNPATLARDAGEIVRSGGYRLKAVGVMDMFPHTSHVEAVALFVREALQNDKASSLMS